MHRCKNITYTVRVRPCVTAKLPVLGPWFWNLIYMLIKNCACFLLLYCLLSLVGRVRCSIILFEDAKCEIAALSITCRLHMILSKPGWRIVRQLSSFHAKPVKGRPHFRQKQYQFQMPISTRLSWSWRSFLCCRDVDKRCPMYWSWFKLSKACNRGASRPSEVWPRPRLGRKTYWHKDKARLTGTRNYIILLLEH